MAEAKTSMDALSKHLDALDAASLNDFFPHRCKCKQCQIALSAQTLVKPCWFMSESMTADLLYASLHGALRGNLRRGAKDRELAMLVFESLSRCIRTKSKMSDIQKLMKMCSVDLEKCLRCFRLNPAGSMLLECAHLLDLCSYKCDRDFVHRLWQQQVLAGNHPDPLNVLNQGMAMTTEEYQTILERMRTCLRHMSSELLIYAYLPESKMAEIELLPEFLIEHCLGFATEWASSGIRWNCDIDTISNPWIVCFNHNFAQTIKQIWLYASCPERIERLAFLYPSEAPKAAVNKSILMSINLFPRIAKGSKCDVCGSKLKLRCRLLALEFAGASNRAKFPREVLRLERPENSWSLPPDIKQGRRSVAVVCTRECLLKNERAKYPEVDNFLMLFHKTLMGNCKDVNFEKYVMHYTKRWDEKAPPALQQLARAFEQVPTLALKLILKSHLSLPVNFTTNDSNLVFLNSFEWSMGPMGSTRPWWVKPEWDAETKAAAIEFAREAAEKSATKAEKTSTMNLQVSQNSTKKESKSSTIKTGVASGSSSSNVSATKEATKVDNAVAKEEKTRIVDEKGDNVTTKSGYENRSDTKTTSTKEESDVRASELRNPEGSSKSTVVDREVALMEGNKIFDEIRSKFLLEKQKESKKVIAFRICLKCNKPSLNMKVCGKCREALYCCLSCLRADKERHKSDCEKSCKERYEQYELGMKSIFEEWKTILNEREAAQQNRSEI